MFLPACLLIINIDWVLNIWLGTVPENSGEFCQILIVCSIIDAVTGPFYCAIMATGRIAKYQILISISFLLDLIVSFVLFHVGVEPYLILMSRILTRGVLNALIGIYSLKSLIGHDVMEYFKKTVVPILSLLVFMIPVSYGLYIQFDGLRLLLISVPVVSVIFLFTCYYILFASSEREYIKSFINKRIRRE